MNERIVEVRRDNTAAIGCGSLILIGLMIFFVGRWSASPIREDVEALRTQVSQLDTKVTELQQTLDETRLEVRAAIVQP